VSLVLPGTRPEEAIGLKLDRMVASEGLSSATLVYLSACRGISRGSVQQLVMNGIPYALGFRWNVEDDRAPHFAKAFYSELHETRSVCLAFRKACRASWERLADDEDSPIWLSPILLAQSTDWATRCN
jgi:CHAT domain-containing protein